jgi:hypothetical protein
MKKERIDQTAKVLEFIENFMEKNSYPPSVRDMCAGLNISSTATIVYHLRKLENQGKLTRAKQKNRALDVVNSKKKKGIPVVGKVAAGIPITATENVEDSFTFSQNVYNSYKQNSMTSTFSAKSGGILWQFVIWALISAPRAYARGFMPKTGRSWATTPWVTPPIRRSPAAPSKTPPTGGTLWGRLCAPRCRMRRLRLRMWPALRWIFIPAA